MRYTMEWKLFRPFTQIVHIVQAVSATKRADQRVKKTAVFELTVQYA